MSLIKTAVVCFTVAVISVLDNGASLVLNSETSVVELDPECLACLCEASSKCNTHLGCQNSYAGGYFCGPFYISWAYWADAGKPVLHNDDPNTIEAFENCANDLFCSSESVRRYIKKFASPTNKTAGDCNSDEVVDCTDFAMMHFFGGYGCRAEVNNSTNFFNRFQNCYNVQLL